MNKHISSKEFRIEILLLLVGCLIYSASTAMIRNVNVIPGSFLGLAAALNKAIGTPTGMVNLMLNIPVMILVTKKLGPKVLIYTIFIVSFTSVLIDWFSGWFPDFSALNIYILAIAGGLSMGLAAGLLILAKGTMAGSTALTLLVQPLFPKISYGVIVFVIDSLIITIGVVILQDWKAILYSLLYTLCCSKVIDIVLDTGRRFGLDSAGGQAKTENTSEKG